jgi:site-specific DNA recombinase
MDQIEVDEPERHNDDRAEADQEFIRRLRDRFAALEIERRCKLSELERLDTKPPQRDHQVDLLDRLPELRTCLSELPEDRQRRLYDVFGLEIRYHPDDHAVTIRVTLSDDTIDSVMTSRRTIEKPMSDGRQKRTPTPPTSEGNRCHRRRCAVCPGRIGTCGTRFRTICPCSALTCGLSSA